MQRSLIDDLAVMISTRNRSEELLTTLRKCIEMGIPAGHVFVTDDDSTDETCFVVNRQFPQVNLIRNRFQRGYIANRNEMMKLIDKPFILSLDDDSNLLSKEDLQEALQILNSRDDFAVFGFNPVEQIALPLKKDFFSSDIYLDKTFIGCGHIIKKKVLGVVGYYPEELIFYGEENDLAVRCFAKNYFVVKKDSLLVHHRIDKEERKRQKTSKLEKGEYGDLWRLELRMRNRLVFIIKYYPSIFLPFFIAKSILGHFYLYIIKDSAAISFWKALAKVISETRHWKRQRQPLSIRIFRRYKRLPSVGLPVWTSRGERFVIHSSSELAS